MSGFGFPTAFGFSTSKPVNPLNTLIPFSVNTDLTKGAGPVTFQRSSKQWITDFEGNYRPVYDNCPAFPGSRVVTNLCQSSNVYSSLPWFKSDVGSIDVSTAPLITLQSGANNLHYRLSVTPNQIYRFSFDVMRGTANELKWSIYNYSSNVSIVNQTSYYSNTSATEYKRLSFLVTIPTSCTQVGFYPLRDTNSTGTVYIKNVMIEDVTAQSNQAPSEYIPTTSAPVTKCYDYLNPMVVDGNGVVTDSGVRQSIIDWRGDELITVQANRDFSSDTGWWSKLGTQSSIANGVMNINGSTDTGYYKSDILTIGKMYEITYEITRSASGSVKVGAGSNYGQVHSAIGKYSDILVCTGAVGNIRCYAGANGTDIDIDNISVKECYPVAKTGIKGLLIEPTKSNKCTCYATIPGDTLGSELVTNGGFDSDTGWNKSTGWTISSGVLNANVSSWSGATQTITATTGKIYKYSLTATITSGSINLYLGTADTDNKILSTVGTNTFTGNIRCGSGAYILNLASSSFVGTIDNVSVKEVILAAGTTANSLNPTVITNMTLSGYNQTTGNLVVGAKYKITARTTLDFTTCGAANNTVGTVFTATSAGTLGTGDSVDNQSVSLSIVDDTTNLTAAKLLSLNSSGKVYKLDNSLGNKRIYMLSYGTTVNQNTHSYLTQVKVSQGTGVLCTDDAGMTTFFTNTTYSTIKKESFTPYGTGARLCVAAEPSSIVYFLMPQLEESPVCTSLMPSQGGSAPRASIITSIPTPAKPVCGVLEWTYGGSTGANQYLWCSYVDSNNYTTLYCTNGGSLIFNKRITGVDYYASKSLSLVVNTLFKIGFRVNIDNTLDIFALGSKGTTQANTNSPIFASTVNIGSKDSIPNSPTLSQIKNMRWFSKPLSDAQMIALTT